MPVCTKLQEICSRIQSLRHSCDKKKSSSKSLKDPLGNSALKNESLARAAFVIGANGRVGNDRGAATRLAAGRCRRARARRGARRGSMAASRVGLVDGSGRSSRRPVSRGSSISVVCVARCCSGRSFFLPPPLSSLEWFVRPRRLLRVYCPRAVVLRGTSRSVVPAPPSAVPREFVRVHTGRAPGASGGPIGR